MNGQPNPLILFAGRTLMALLFLFAGIRKIMYYSGTAGYFAHIGLPAPHILLPLVILIEVGGSAMLIAGWKVRYAALTLAAFSLLAGFAGHQFWAADAASYNNQFYNFWKNVSIVGGLLYIASIGPGSLVLGGRKQGG
jgi:putative oxidoreductase